MPSYHASNIAETEMAADLARRFQKLQEQRTQEFHQLDQHHKIFLCHAPEYEIGFDDYKKGRLLRS